MTAIISSCISGALALVGVIITSILTNSKTQSLLQTNQAVTDVKIEELTREVRSHNNFASEIPVIQHRLDQIERRLENEK